MHHQTPDRVREVGASTADHRRMVQAELPGGHTHEAAQGRKVHVWKRGKLYLARGRHNGRYFGEPLGADVATAARSLRRVLAELDDGAYVPPSERRVRLVAVRRP